MFCALCVILTFGQLVSGHDVPLLGGSSNRIVGESPFSLSLTIQVGVLGVAGTSSGSRNTIFDFNEKLRESLTQSLPALRPHVHETKEPLHVQYEFDYEVKEFAPTRGPRLAEKLSALMHYAGDSGNGNHIYDVDASAFEEHIYDAYVDTFGQNARTDDSSRTQEPYAVIFVNFNKRDVAPAVERGGMNIDPSGGYAARQSRGGQSQDEVPKKEYIYRYLHNGGPPTQSWVSKHRFVVVDLSACGPGSGCRYGALSDWDWEDDADHAVSPGEGAVSEYSYPRFETSLSNSGSNVEHAVVEVKSHMASIVISAIRHVFAPDIRFSSMDYAEQIFMPVIFLRNHRADPQSAGYGLSTDTSRFKESIDDMLLPNQELFTKFFTLDISGVPLLDKAWSKALKTSLKDIFENGARSTESRQYIDTTALWEALGPPGSLLDIVAKHTDGFLPMAPALVSSGLAGDASSTRTPHGTRVLPVFVFSMDPPPAKGLTLDQRTLVSSSHDGVVVLQQHDDVPVPYFVDSARQSLGSRDPRNLIYEGIASSLGGLMPPFARHSSKSSALSYDFLWSTGAHPFGPFAHSSHLSRIFIDTIRRNALISRISATWDLTHEAIADIEEFAAEYGATNKFSEVLHPALLTAFRSGGFGKRAAASLDVPDDLEAVLQAMKEQADAQSRVGRTEALKAIPMVTVNRLNVQARDLKKKFDDVRESLDKHELEEAYQRAGALTLFAKNFVRYCRSELTDAREQLKDCNTTYVVKKRSRFLSWLIAVATFVVLLFLFFIIYVSYMSIFGKDGRASHHAKEDSEMSAALRRSAHQQKYRSNIGFYGNAQIRRRNRPPPATDTMMGALHASGSNGLDV